MHVKKVELMISAVGPDQYPIPDTPEIALAGRSNVGKSSFINAMVDRVGLARTSSKPGKTQTLNFYNVDDCFRFVDVPGYGYAQVSKKSRDQWSKMIDNYITQRPNLVAMFLLMDFRHPPTVLDIEMKDFVEDIGLPYAIIATKADKIKTSQFNKHLSQFVNVLNLPTQDAIFIFSSETKTGKDDLWDVIDILLNK